MDANSPNGVRAVTTRRVRAASHCRVVALMGADSKPFVRRLAGDALASVGIGVAAIDAAYTQSGALEELLAAAQGADAIIAEADEASVAQAAAWAGVVQPHVAVLVGDCADKNGVACARAESACAEILRTMDKGASVFVNASDPVTPHVLEQSQALRRGLFVYGYDGSGDEPSQCHYWRPGIYARSIVYDDAGAPSFDICSELFDRFEAHQCTPRLHGGGTVCDVVAAAGVCLACGMRLKDVAAAFNVADPDGQ